MSTVSVPQLVSVEEYIARFVNGGEKPMCEYVDGELIPKPMPKKDHSRVQGNIVRRIVLAYDDEFEALPELTTRVSKARFFVPDVAISELAKPIRGQYPGPEEPVYLCVEINSLDTRVGKLFEKCEKYHGWGVPYCWVVDPQQKVAWEYDPGDVEPRRKQGSLQAGVIEISFEDLFRRVT